MQGNPVFSSPPTQDVRRPTRVTVPLSRCCCKKGEKMQQRTHSDFPSSVWKVYVTHDRGTVRSPSLRDDADATEGQEKRDFSHTGNRKKENTPSLRPCRCASVVECEHASVGAPSSSSFSCQAVFLLVFRSKREDDAPRSVPTLGAQQCVFFGPPVFAVVFAPLLGLPFPSMRGERTGQEPLLNAQKEIVFCSSLRLPVPCDVVGGRCPIISHALSEHYV